MDKNLLPRRENAAALPPELGADGQFKVSPDRHIEPNGFNKETAPQRDGDQATADQETGDGVPAPAADSATVIARQAERVSAGLDKLDAAIPQTLPGTAEDHVLAEMNKDHGNIDGGIARQLTEFLENITNEKPN